MSTYALKYDPSPMPGAPRLESSDTGIGPGPLSPAWPQPKPAEPPSANRWLALADELSALRRACFLSLRETTPGGQLLLSIAERDDLNDKLRLLREASLVHLGPYHRWSGIEQWTDPVLPSNVLWGARDLAEVLGIAVRIAATLGERTGRDGGAA
ncbi:MAG: hypothetical protein ABI697_01480 [Devosia sp.]